MNKRNENRLTMYEGLLTLFQANGAKVQTVGGFPDAVAEFSLIISSLKVKSAEVDSVAVGKTNSKYSAEEVLVEAVLPMMAALYLYGRKQKNEELLAFTNISETKLRSKRDTELAKYGNAIADFAATHAKGLASFKITSAMITDLKTKSEAYNTAIGVRESSVVDRKGARETMNELFEKADELLNEEFDRFMELLRTKESEFYNKYFTARVIKDTGIRHKTNGEPINPATPTVAKTV
ncbi:MAG: hypothetical protein WDA22_12850 [Bacteroidota bacterium]